MQLLSTASGLQGLRTRAYPPTNRGYRAGVLICIACPRLQVPSPPSSLGYSRPDYNAVLCRSFLYLFDKPNRRPRIDKVDYIGFGGFVWIDRPSEDVCLAIKGKRKETWFHGSGVCVDELYMSIPGRKRSVYCIRVHANSCHQIYILIYLFTR